MQPSNRAVWRARCTRLTLHGLERRRHSGKLAAPVEASLALPHSTRLSRLLLHHGDLASQAI